MLDHKTCMTGADLAAVLTSQGIQVAPLGGVPLAKLNQTLLGAGLGNLTGITMEEEERKEFDQGYMAMMVSHSQTTLPDGSPTEYQAYLQMLVQQISDSVSGTVAFARNVVNPIIKDVCDKIMNKLDEAGQGGALVRMEGGQRFAMSNGSLVVNIHEEGPESIYMDSVTETEVSGRLKSPYQNLTSPVIFPELNTNQLYEYLVENADSDFQRDVLEELKLRDDGYELLLNVYNQAYCFRPGVVSGLSIRDLTNDLTLRPLIVLALGLALVKDLPEGTRGSASNIESLTSAWVNQVKNIIGINIEVYKQALNDKTLVTNSYSENFETHVSVSKENYNAYLESGGSTEALLGAVFSDKDYDFDNLITNQSKYEALYERRVADAATFNEANRLTIFKNTLREEIYNCIFYCDEDAIRPVVPAEARQALDLLMKKIYVDALDHPHETVRSVVCNSLFIGTDAEEILVNIDNVSKKNPDLSVRDAGALVVLDYLSKYLVSQMCVKRIQ